MKVFGWDIFGMTIILKVCCGKFRNISTVTKCSHVTIQGLSSHNPLKSLSNFISNLFLSILIDHLWYLLQLVHHAKVLSFWGAAQESLTITSHHINVTMTHRATIHFYYPCKCSGVSLALASSSFEDLSQLCLEN